MSVDNIIQLLTQWARGKKKRLLLVPPLYISCNADSTAFKFIDKVNMFRNTFFLQTQADLSDISDKKTLMSCTNFQSAADTFFNRLEISDKVLYKDIYLISASKLSQSALSYNYIFFNFLKTMSSLIINTLCLIINVC